MPDISAVQAAEAESSLMSSPTSPPADQQPPAPTATAGTTGGHNKFSYTKNWGEVSNTLRKKLSKRLSALKESDDNSGDEDRAYRSDRSQVDGGARSPPDSLLSGRSDRVGSPHERSPDALLGADGLSSVRHSRAAIWQKISSASAVPVMPTAGPADRPAARFNRVGTAFQGMYVAPAARLGRARTDEDGVGSSPTRPGSGTPEREYRSLAAFITRSATPERLRARSNTPGGGRTSRAGTPERQANTEASPRTGTRTMLVREGDGRRLAQGQGEEDDITRSLSSRNDATNDTDNDGNIDETENVTACEDDEKLREVSQGSNATHVSGQKDVNQDTGAGSKQTDRYQEDIDDEDDENCLACKSERSESQQLSLASPVSEDVLSSPRSMHSSNSDHSSSKISPRRSSDDVISNGSTASRKGTNSKDDNKDVDRRSTSRMSRTVTHFVEVTSVEDGNKRITYVENGVTVEPVIVSKRSKESHGRKSRTKTLAPKAIEEEEDSRSMKSLPADSESTRSMISSQSKSRHSPSFQDATCVSECVTPSVQSTHSEVTETPASSPGAAADTAESLTKEGSPLEPGPHTGAIPKRRDRYGTRVVKFPKDGSRGRHSTATESQDGCQRPPGDSSDGEKSPKTPEETAAESSCPTGLGSMRNGPVEPRTATEQTHPCVGEAEPQSGSVARRQALYESISEVNAARRTITEPKPDPPPPPPARPAVMPPAPTAAPSAGQTPTESTGFHEPASGAASSAAGSDTNGGERNYRLRRSALEALPVRVPSVRELMSSRFSEPEPAESLEHGDPDKDADLWVTEPLDEERQEAQSDGDSSNHSRDSANDSHGSANHSQDSASDSHGSTNHSQESGLPVDDGKHSLLQYAMTHFRAADERYNKIRDDEGAHLKMLESKNKKNKKKGKEDWTWKEQVELVKWTDQPLRAPLLKLTSPEMARLALESFRAILRYMGDQDMPREVTDVDCVYTVLMSCHRYPALRDEIYCQLMRQTTSNRSPQAASCERGWRLLSLVAAYFACSDSLLPYLSRYLETAAGDPRRDHRRTASVSLQNLRRTVRLGGRRNVPSSEEVAAVTDGRTVRLQRYLLPGGTQRVVSTRCTTVVQDVLGELCRELGVTSEEEQEEFSLYCVVEGDAFTLPLPKHEYIIDVTTELQKNGQVFHLVLCRTVWFCPLRLDSQPYVEAVFSQAAPDYLEGLLLVMPAEALQQHVVFDIARVAALLHRAAGLRTMPTMKETKYLLPKAALLVRDIKPPQWVNMVQDSWTEVQDKTPAESRRAVLETLSQWPLFGSAFFVVGVIPEGRGEAAADHLLAIHSRGLHLLDTVTHETRSRYPLRELLSTRRVRSEAGDLFIDIKVGTPKQAKVVRLQSESAVEISRLIRQYSVMEQRHRPMAERVADTRERQVSR